METELTGFRPHASTSFTPLPQHQDPPMDPIHDQHDHHIHIISNSTSPYQRTNDGGEHIPPHHTLEDTTTTTTTTTTTQAPLRHSIVTWLTLIGIGQLLSLFITGTGTFSQLLSERGVDIPTTQSFCNYVLLSGFLLIPIIRQHRRHPSSTSLSHDISNDSMLHDSHDTRPQPRCMSLFGLKLHIPWWQYGILAICDVEGNYFLVKAYQYTTITSVQLLDCFTIPAVMILSRIFFRTRYNRKHLFGAALCIIGLGLLVASDLLSERYDTSSTNQAIGDILVLIGCCFYAISNIGQEHIVKSHDRYEFMGMMGLCGSIISGIQMAILERDALSKVDFRDSYILSYMFGFSLCLFLLYTLTPILIQHSSAIFLNLSFLTSDFWSILVAVFVFHASLNGLYFVAFAIIIIGLMIYNLAGADVSYASFCAAICSPFCPSNQTEQHGDEPLMKTNSHGDSEDTEITR